MGENSWGMICKATVVLWVIFVYNIVISTDGVRKTTKNLFSAISLLVDRLFQNHFNMWQGNNNVETFKHATFYKNNKYEMLSFSYEGPSKLRLKKQRNSLVYSVTLLISDLFNNLRKYVLNKHHDRRKSG
jgi:hypothetical protein